MDNQRPFFWIQEDEYHQLFYSPAAMRAVHFSLAQRSKEDRFSDDFKAQINDFIQKGKRIGLLIESIGERKSLQSILNYWHNFYVNNEGDDFDPTLLAADASFIETIGLSYDAFFTNDDQKLARKILPYFFAGIDDHGDISLQAVSYQQLAHDIDWPQEKLNAVLQKLAGASFLYLPESLTEEEGCEVQIGFESLLRRWPLFALCRADWEEAQSRANRLAAAAEQWMTENRDPGFLWRGEALSEVAFEDVLSEQEAEFIRASQTAVFQEAAASAQAAKRFRMLTIISMIALAFVVIFGSGTVINGQRAVKSEATAVSSAATAEHNENEAVAARATSDANAVIADEARKVEAEARAAAVESASAAEEAREQEAVARADADESARIAEEAREQEAIARAVAEEQARLVIARSLTESATDQAGDPDLSLLLALEAVNVDLRAGDMVPPFAEETLNQTLQDFPQRRTFLGHTDWVNDVAFSPDGTQIATASNDATIKIWEVTTGKELFTLERHSRPVTAVTFNKAGTRLASGGEDGFVNLWNVTGNYINALGGRHGAVRSLDFHPDDRRLLAGYDDGTVRVWDIAIFQSLWDLKEHNGPVNAVAFTPDGDFFASAGEDGRIIIRQSENSTSLSSIEPIEGELTTINALTFSPDGDLLIAGYAGGTLRVWDFQSGERIVTLREHTNLIFDISINSDGTRLASASRDETVKVWDMASWKNISTLVGHDSAVTAVAFDPQDGQLLVSGSQDKLAKLWNAESGFNPLILAGHTSSINRIAFQPGGALVATGNDDKSVRFWDGESGELVFNFTDPNGPVNDVEFSPNGMWLAAGSDDGVAWLLKAATGEDVYQFVNHGGPVTAVSFSPDSTQLATSSEDGFVRVWDIEKRRLLYDFNQLDAVEADAVAVQTVVFNHDGTRVIAGDNLGNVVVWDVEGETAVTHIAAHPEAVVNDVAVTPNGRWLATAGSDGVAKVWSFTGELIASMGGHSGNVWSVEFYQDGTRLATSGVDRTVRLWDAASGQLLRTITNHQAPVRDVTFSADGLRMATASADSTAQISDFDTVAELFAKANRLIGRSLTEEECKLYMPDSECPTVFPLSP